MILKITLLLAIALFSRPFITSY